MKILIYLGHPAHFHLYKNSILSWKAKGIKCFILIKKKDVLEDLLNTSNLEYYNILIEGRRDTGLGIFIGLIKRSFRLLLFCLKNKPDILTGTSVENSFIGKLLNIPVINLNEDDAAVVPLYARLSYPLADVILNPRVCNSGKWDKKAIKYESYHELAYLHPNNFTPDKKIVEKYFNLNTPYFLIRFAKLNAHHDFGIKGINDEIAEKIIEILKPHGRIFITSERQFDSRFEPFRINIDPKDIHHVMAFADIYIGDSQTMAAESGILGVPFIRFNDFVGRIGYLNELENHYNLGFGIKTNDVDKLYSIISQLLQMPNRKLIYQQNKIKMLEDKLDFAFFLTEFIENYPSSKLTLKNIPDFKLKSIDFTLNTYQDLLLSLKKNSYTFMTFEEWCKNKRRDKIVILRHDVDLKALNSLIVAKIENNLKIKSTYYFRFVKKSNKPSIIKTIVNLGHEIGYHYEDLSVFKGDYNKSIEHFENMLDYFKQFYPVKTISMHGSPMSKYDNRDIWEKYNYKDFGIIGEPYFEFINDKSNKYFTDTARMWSGIKFNVRDKISKDFNQKNQDIHSTFDLINWIETSDNQMPIMITTHPQRWSNNIFEWMTELIVQNIKNPVKNIVVKNRE